MEALPLSDLQKLPQAIGFPRADNALYLGDHIIRRILEGGKDGLPECLISAGIGQLKVEGPQIVYRPKIKPKPGEVLTILIRELIGEVALPKCKCAERARQMNEWGWSGCWQHRRKIMNWLLESAEAVQQEIDKDRALSLFKTIALDGFIALSR